MDDQFLQQQYEYYRIAYNQSENAWMSAPLSYAQWKEKIQTCEVRSCPRCGNSTDSNKLSWLPYAIGGLVIGLYLKRK